MQDDTARHGIGGNNPPELLDDIQSPLLSIKQSRRYLGGIGQSTLYDWTNKGEIEIVKLGGRRFCTKRSLDALIARNTRPSLSDEQPKALKPPRKPRTVKRKLVPGKARPEPRPSTPTRS
jgi:hypothetical protein